MKLKILILSLLLPLSAVAQNRTNAFDNVLINNKLQVDGASLFKGQMIAIGPSNSFNIGFGIGVTNGNADFHLRSANAFALIQNTTAAGNGDIQIRNDLNSGSRALQMEYSGTANNERGSILTTGNQKLFLGAGNVEFITISPGAAPSLRFFGINTNSPTAPLHVFGQSVLDGDVSITSNLTVAGNSTFGDAASDTVTMNASTMAIPNNWDVGSSALFISNAVGFVGIGTNAPEQRLTVNGSILAIGYGSSNSASFMAKPGTSPTGGAGNSNYIFSSFYNDNVTPSFGIQVVTNVNFRTFNNSAGFIFVQNGTTRASFGSTQVLPNRVFIGSGANGAVVGSSTISNSMVLGFSGTYGGSSTTIVFASTFQVAPFVTVTKTEPGGTALLNDQAWVTNVTTTTCVIGFRDSTGGQSAGTFTFNGIGFGLKGN